MTEEEIQKLFEETIILLKKNNAQHGENASWINGAQAANRAAFLICENDLLIKKIERR